MVPQEADTERPEQLCSVAPGLHRLGLSIRNFLWVWDRSAEGWWISIIFKVFKI